MAKKVEASVEKRLRALYDLQLIDSRIDEIKNLRGELPLEVRDLEDEVEGLTKRLEKLKQNLKVIDDQISTKKNFMEDAKNSIKKYSEQQKNVRNNREYNSLSKEIEYQELEIELANKHIKEFRVQIEQKKEIIAQIEEKLQDKEAHLNHKKDVLEAILKETEEEEKVLLSKFVEFQNKIDERMVKAYKRIRNSVKNGLAVVAVERGASGGSFFTIPPQIQVEILSRKKVITDEHSGRILVDATLAEEEKNKMEKLFSKLSR